MSENKLPKNRFQLFISLIKNRMNIIFDCGLINLIFSIPSILIVLYFNLMMSKVDTSLTIEEIYLQMFNIIKTQNLLLIPSTILLFIGLSGTVQIIRNIIFDKEVLFKSDFKRGLKENYRIFILFGFIIGLANYIMQYLLYSNIDTTTLEFKVVMIISIVVIVLLIGVTIIVLSETTIYSQPLLHKIKNALMFIISKGYIILPLSILNIAVYFIVFIPSSISFFLSIILLPLVFSPYIIMIDLMFTDYIFDIYINKDNYPEIYKKGMMKNE